MKLSRCLVYVGKRNTSIYVVHIFAIFVIFLLTPVGNILVELGLKYRDFFFVNL